ncbi:PadR family transcriptional regulator [Sporolactobacillus sp. THM19-2]|uniref:PadR family transcriptional regulator n=1 Tax=Sporolactobacillus sp. THM19-2 TaxID=2511171 RepID=UPI00101F56E4|nr:PadR family transcriptional regulator [Sporolactobacillus sp. THM19-2]RYL91656.1 PadR family transcriptional regulator [Sporolactobacillus sp. THM19-2]
MSSSQMLKGILEGCLLAIIAKGEIYGYEMMEKLSDYGFTMVREGSIYPLLIRMRREGLVTTHSKRLPSGGPQRKYYTLTDTGKKELDVFKKSWRQISSSVNHVLEEEK